MQLYGKKLSKREFEGLVGDIGQVLGVRKIRMDEGKAAGVCAYEVRTGGGLSYTVLPDRGMDIPFAEYKGVPLNFLSKTGVVHPAYFNDRGYEYARGFFGGLLSTCGLTYMGEACIDGGIELGKHGRINNTPAESSGYSLSWDGDELLMAVSGSVRESSIAGENMVMRREIHSTAGAASIKISDTVENCGFRPEPMMMLYHFNFGFPLVSEDTSLYLPAHNTIPFPGESERLAGEYGCFSPPCENACDLVYYHILEKDPEGFGSAALFNPRLGENGLGISLHYPMENLPVLVQWKSMKYGDYVTAIEPSTGYVDGRAAARERSELTILEPDESRRFEIELTVFDGEAAFLSAAERMGLKPGCVAN